MEHHRPIDPHWRMAPTAGDEWRDFAEGLLADPDGAVLVWDAEDLDGFCAVRVRRAPPDFAEQARGEIMDLFVRKEVRRRGIGGELVRAALGWCAARGGGRVEVRVAAANAEGQAFWRALGFGDFVDVLQHRL
jgi:GNAT superfamily N-acetyltransferase